MAEACEVADWLKSLPCAPEFRPTEAEFADPVVYISKIEAEARTYGICKIIPPFPRASKRTVMANLNRSLLLQPPDSCSSAAHGTSTCEFESRRSMGGCMPPQKVGRSISDCCPPPPPHSHHHPRTRSSPLSSFIEGDDLKAKFDTRRQQLGCSTGKRSKAPPVQTLAQKLVWQSGESYTLEQFEAKAKQLARARLKTSKDLPPFLIESLFWKAAADRTVTVEYGNDIPGSAFGEPPQLATMDPITRVKRKWGFDEEDQVHSLRHPSKEPKLEDPELESCADDFSSQFRSSDAASSCGISSRGKQSSVFVKERLRPRRKTGRADVEGRAGSELANSFWNMKVMPRAPGSLLRYMPDEVPGVTSPMVYIGMLFSWFAWHVEDHELHSLNYLHIGAPKTWYAVPGDAAPALEEVVRVYGYGNSTGSKAAFTLLGEKTTVMSPEVLLAAGVPCCRLVQNAGDFVVTFPRAYHLGFSHGFNCGEAANFASPAWLEVAKDAATRRAAMSYLPMLSHQQLLYLLALSFFPRVPLALAFEPRSSRSKDTLSSLGEESVKIVFTNDAAHNNRLLGLLIDSGVTGCILLSDRADLSSALSEQSKVSCSAFDNDLRSTNFLVEMLSEEACDVENERKHAGGSRDHGCALQELKCHTEAHEMKMSTSSSFRWGTLPCAACGLLCFPSMAIVQPVSHIEKSLALAQHLNNSDNGSLPSFCLKEEEGHEPDTGHLPSFFAMNDVDLQSDFMRAPLSDAMYNPGAHVKLEGRTLHWEMEQEAIQGCVKDFHGANGKVLDHILHGEIGNANAIQHDIEETQKFVDGSFNCQEDMVSDCVATKDANVVESTELKLVLQNDKVLSQASSGIADQVCFPQTPIADISGDHPETAQIKNPGYHSSGSMFEGCENSLMLNNLLLVDDMVRTGHRVTGEGSATSVLDLLAVTYGDESEDSGLYENRKKPVLHFKSSTVERENNKLITEQDNRMKLEVEDLCMANAELWKRPASDRDHICNEAPHNHQESSSPSTSSRPRFLCLEHALEAYHQLKLRGGSHMLIICHSDIAKIESHAQHLAKELSLIHNWRSIPYNEATQEHKHLIEMAVKAEEEGEDNSEDWVVQLGMSVRHCENKISSDFSNSLYEADVTCESKAELLHGLDSIREDEVVGKVAKHRKVSVAGLWCGKVWMNDQVHPALGGSYTAQTRLEALQITGRDALDNAKASSSEQICTETFKGVTKSAKETNLLTDCEDAGLLPEFVAEIERTNRKRKAFEQTGDLVHADLDFQTEVPNESKRRELAGDSATLDTSCLTSAVRKKSDSFEELTDYINQGSGCNMQLSNGNTSNSNGGNSQVSDVDAIDQDGSDMDIWQDLDVGCYSQEVLSLDTIAGVADPLIVGTCHELDAEAQGDLIPGMLRRRSCSPFDCADFFCEGPSTRLRSRSAAKAISLDDDEVVNGKHSEGLFGSGKKRKQPRQKAKKQVMKDLEDECGAYICELDGCSMSFSSKQELNLHKRNTCTFVGCGKRFGSHKYLLQHRRVHLDDRPLKCPWKGCKMTFKWKWACTEHYRVHTGERPYVCPIPECGRTFRFVSDFSRHKRKTGHTK